MIIRYFRLLTAKNSCIYESKLIEARSKTALALSNE